MVKALDEMDKLLSNNESLQDDMALTIPDSVAVFPPSSAVKINVSPVVSQTHSHIAPPIL